MAHEEFSFARILEDDWIVMPVGSHPGIRNEVDGAVVVVIRPNRGDASMTDIVS
jgi:hypothetical protein